jgi:subtilisin family serine protease
VSAALWRVARRGIARRGAMRAVVGRCAVVVAVLCVWCAGEAWAEEDGTWWFASEQVAAAHAAGADGSGVDVAVIDGSMNAAVPMFSDALADGRLRVHEPSFCADRSGGDPYPATSEQMTFGTAHGTNVVGLIVGNGRGVDGGVSVSGIAPGANVTFYADNDPAVDTRTSFCPSGDSVAFAMMRAVDDGARIISISHFGEGPSMREAVAWALHEGVIVVIAAGECEGDTTWMNSLNGVISVHAITSDGRLMQEADPAGMLPPGTGKVTVTAPGVDILLQGDLDALTGLPRA